jgi:hypothetical protein
VLERVLDKGLVIAGDIQISLLDIELLTIKVRLLLASADTAQQMGIDWWKHDPFLSSQAAEDEREELRERVELLERAVAATLPPAERGAARPGPARDPPQARRDRRRARDGGHRRPRGRGRGRRRRRRRRGRRVVSAEGELLARLQRAIADAEIDVGPLLDEAWQEARDDVRTTLRRLFTHELLRRSLDHLSDREVDQL